MSTPDKSKVNKENIAAWVAALRSDEFIQSRKALRGYVRDDDGELKVGHCCLDVANILCQRAGAMNDVEYPADESSVDDIRSTALTYSAVRWLGLIDPNGNSAVNPTVTYEFQDDEERHSNAYTTLMWLNDGPLQKDFHQIADVIEKEWLSD